MSIPQSGEIPDPLPRSFGKLLDFLSQADVDVFAVRLETFRRIEKETARPLLCYATQTWKVSPGTPAFIDDGDLIGFCDLIDSVEGNKADIFLISNGGSPEATERIVGRLRDRFESLRFFVPSNAYSAATLMCFSGNQILMLPEGTFGPIDPQLSGVPARAILRAFGNLEKRLSKEGPESLTAYLPLLQKYDLHLLELCRNAQQLSEDLAKAWLSQYAMQGADEEQVDNTVEFFGNWDLHKSHGRSISLETAQAHGIPVQRLEDRLADLVRSLHHQYFLLFERTPLYKVFENSSGIVWGRQQAQPQLNLPFPGPSNLLPIPEPSEPRKSSD